ncbi:hypothetical protein MPSEU_000318400 [Mayamaea pseudoterrestris]|nr:hypothetical protein MPSEU_000318400 [Mayamaea pseudoterrestris]
MHSSSSDAMKDSSSSSPAEPTCVLDQTVVNADTLPLMKDLGLSFFASLCGMNRGAFVLQPSDNQTYSCLHFPKHFPSLAGVNKHRFMNVTSQVNVTDSSSSKSSDDNSTATTKEVTKEIPYDLIIKDANAIKETYQMHNVTANETVQLLDYLIKSVYHSTPGKDMDPYACNVNGLATLQCAPVNTIRTIRAVTLAGLYVPALWATNGKELSINEQDDFYTRRDFEDMRALGLNTVQIPVPMEAFSEHDRDKVKSRLADLLHEVGKANLQAILMLVGEDNDDAVAAAAHYAADHSSTVFALTLPSMQSIGAARAAESSLKLMVPVSQGDLSRLNFHGDANIFAALDVDHTSTVADVASSNAEDDRSKLFYHESTACVARSPLEFTHCYKRIPVFVAKGFDLSIDNCFRKEFDPKFVDYGQCGRFDETVDSGWWSRHRSSFAVRQLFSYEHGLGWSFATWKLHGGDKSSSSSGSTLDSPASLLALKNVAAAGLFPSLDGDDKAAVHEIAAACLNGPEADFILGDRTLAPTMGPPPACPNNGWWNYTAEACEYWVPPPTDAPSGRPTVAPVICPEVSPATIVCNTSSSSSGHKAILLSAGAGSVMTLVLIAILTKVFGRKREGYTAIPNSNVV